MNHELSSGFFDEARLSKIVMAIFVLIGAYLAFAAVNPVALDMNAVLVSVLAMLILSLVKVNVVISLITASVIAQAPWRALPLTIRFHPLMQAWAAVPRLP